jgi:hypothetical protein
VGLNAISGNTLLIYLNLHGGADREGPYLLADRGAAAFEDRVRLRVIRILDRIAQLPEGMNKVLMLDATHFEFDCILGLLRNDFESRLAELEPRIVRIPNLVVISACGAGERSWDCPSWRRSVFGYYLRRGLDSAEAAAGSTVTAESLYDYLCNRVDAWAHVNRGAAQIPVLLPTGNTGRVRARRITLASAGGRGPRPSPVAVPSLIPTSVAEEWQARDRLRFQFPGTVLPALHAWHAFEAALLRYEELCRAGTTRAAAEMKRRVGILRNAIGQLGQLDLASNDTSLAMDELQGTLQPEPAGRPDSATLNAQFERFWSESSIDKAKAIWDGIKGQPGVLHRFDERLLDRVVADPNSQLNKAIQLLPVMHDDPRRLLPAEVHALAMLVRDRPASSKSSADVYLPALSRALSVRRLAEEVALATGLGEVHYSDEIAPWVLGGVDAADRDRRLGEDLLFSSEPDRWRQASDLVNRAEAAYQAAARTGNRLGEAMAVRDRSFVELPEVTRWASQLPIGREDNANVRNLSTRVADAWPIALGLEASLRSERLAKTLTEVSADGPLSGVESLSQALDAIHRQVEIGVEAAKRSAGPRDEPRIAAALQLTSLPWEDRQPLLQTLGSVIAMTIDPGTPALAREPIAQHLDDWERHALLANASVGLPSAPPPAGDDPALVAGERVGARYVELESGFRRSVGAVIRLLRGSEAATDLASIRRELEAAASLARLIPGSLSPGDYDPNAPVSRLRVGIPGTDAVDLRLAPEIALRDMRLQALMLRMADRCISDHWSDQGPETRAPYFRRAGGLLLSDARALDLLAGDGPGEVSRPVDAAGLSRVEGRLARDGGPNLVGLAPLTITSEPLIRLDYRLSVSTAPSDSSQGFATIWVDGVGRDLTVRQPNNPADRALLGMEPTGSEILLAPSNFQVAVATPLVNQAETSLQSPFPRAESFLRVKALWRGRLMTSETPIEIRPVPDVTVSRPSVRSPGKLAVRADPSLLRGLGRGRGGLAILVDCSGSMAGRVGRASGKTKYQVVVDAVVGLLPEIPQGTQVSLWIFGQRLTPSDTAADAERTIRPLLAPTLWDPNDKASIEAVAAELGRHRPCNQSPVVRAVLRARDDLLGVDGPRTILALTDGIDNRFDLEQQAVDRPLAIPEALREQFQNSGVRVDLVGFQVAPGEWDRAYQQFGVLLTLPTAGRFLRADDPQELATVVRSGLPAEVKYRVETLTGALVPGMASAGQEVAREGRPDRFVTAGIDPGTYRLKLPGDQGPGQDIRFNWNDVLILRLIGPAGSPTAVREDLLHTDYSAWPNRRTAGWGAAVLGNSAGPKGGLSILVAIAKTPVTGEVPLSQHRPTEPWFSVRPRSGEPSVIPIRWCVDPTYPIPVYQVRLPNWPQDPTTGLAAGATIRGWWLDEGQHVGPGIELRRGSDFQSLGDLVGQSYNLAGRTVVVEDIAVERHTVEVRPSTVAPVDCLAIRLRCDESQAVQVVPRGIELEGSEHRYYVDSSRYTGLFWPITDDQLARRPEALVIRSIANLVPRAEAAGCTVSFDDLPPPTLGTQPPAPPAIDEGLRFPEPLPAALPDGD